MLRAMLKTTQLLLATTPPVLKPNPNSGRKSTSWYQLPMIDVGRCPKGSSKSRERAFLHGKDAILDGVRIQLLMHTRWAFGGGDLNRPTWRKLPIHSPRITWQDVALGFIKVLLQTHSSEVLGAALEGMQCLVDQDPKVVRKLFDAIDGEWSRKWLLMAAEPWAVLYPDAIAAIREHLQDAMVTGDLDSRLQAWIVLSRNCDVRGEERVNFPIADSPQLAESDLERVDSALLEVPPKAQGHAILAN